jgi:hypothetical protein
MTVSVAQNRIRLRPASWCHNYPNRPVEIDVSSRPSGCKVPIIRILLRTRQRLELSLLAALSS